MWEAALAFQTTLYAPVWNSERIEEVFPLFNMINVWLPLLLWYTCVSLYVCTHCISCLLGYIVCCQRASCTFLFVCLFVLCAVSSVSSFPSSDHLFQGQLFSRLTREWYRRLLPRSISSKWSKGEFTLLTFSCTVAVLTFNCLSVFRANSHLVPDNRAIPGLPCLACHSLRHHIKQPLVA